MTTSEAIEILREMNKWRRGEPPYDGETPKDMPYSPQEFGEAIDIVCDYLSYDDGSIRDNAKPCAAYRYRQAKSEKCCGTCAESFNEDISGNCYCRQFEMTASVGMVCDEFKRRRKF